MSRTTFAVAILATALGASSVSAQAPSFPIPADREAKVLPRQKLSGPRFGFTVFTGETADQRNLIDLEPLMTQFGWQFETQLVSQTGGNQALMEWLFLVGGLEQSEFNMSLAWMAGYRLPTGVEFGVGPNFSFNPDQEKTTTSMVFAGGATLPFGDMYVPVNLGIAVAKGGPRLTALLGWIVG